MDVSITVLNYTLKARRSLEFCFLFSSRPHWKTFQKLIGITLILATQVMLQKIDLKIV